MIDIEILHSPVKFLRHMLGALPHEHAVASHVRPRRKPVDEILYHPEYWRELRQGYQAGVVWRGFEDQSLSAIALLDYITRFCDPGLTCPYVISLATAVALDRHGSPDLKAWFLPHLLQRDDTVWQGATWMTEIKGGSALGANVQTVAQLDGGAWLWSPPVLTVRPQACGLALFLLPKRPSNGH